MVPELVAHMRALTPLLYIVTPEEDVFIRKMHDRLKEIEKQVYVYNGAFGLLPIADLVKNWQDATHKVGPKLTITDALAEIYTHNPIDEEHFYIFTDPERWLKDEVVVRRLLNILHKMQHDLRATQILMFVGHKAYIPEKLSTYMEVVDLTVLPPDEIVEHARRICEVAKAKLPDNAAELFRGLTTWQMLMAIGQSVTATRRDPVDPKRVVPELIRDYRRSALRKTDLIQQIDTSRFSPNQVGGLQRFKEWAREMKSTWTPEGEAAGLKPPRGVLLIGVHGCGKSLSVKTLSSLWNLPLVQLDIGRLMAGIVGESENNLHKALRAVEGAAPCILWIDEAEKALAGAQSSGKSDAGTTSRVLAILSTWVQETRAKVTLAMTANSLKTLPVEMVNRMDERFFVDIPSEEDRIDILKILLTQRKQDPGRYDSLAALAEAAAGLVGRELEQAVGRAAVRSFNAKKPGIDEEILKEELQKKPRIIKAMRDEIIEIVQWVGYDETAKDGIRARLAGRFAPNLKLVEGGS